MSARKILITGGAGFIGVNAATFFIRKGFDVIVLDNLSRKGCDINLRFLEENFAGRFTFVKADICTDLAALSTAVSAVDVVLHLAAQVAVTTSVTDPRNDFQINALGTFNVLEAVRLSKNQPIVLFASTNKVYGGLEHVAVSEHEASYSFTDGRHGITEEEILDFHSPYGCSKGAADQYVRDYGRIYGLRTVVFRQSCVYGPHQLGVEDQGWVAWFLIAAQFGRPVSIYGNGKQVRDLLYIDDLIRLYDLAIEHIDVANGQVYNAGGGHTNTLSLRNFLSFIQTDLGLKMDPKFAAVRPGDQPIFISDNAKAFKDFGWKAEMNVSDGIRALHTWLAANREQLAEFYAR